MLLLVQLLPLGRSPTPFVLNPTEQLVLNAAKNQALVETIALGWQMDQASMKGV